MRDKKYLFLLLISALLVFSLTFLTFVSAQTYSVKVTLEHPFLINGKWIPASELKVGDLLTTADGKKAKITYIEDVVLNKSVNVYNLEAGEYSNFILPGEVVVHNSGKPIKEDPWIGEVLGQGELSPQEVNRIYKSPYSACSQDCPGYEICSFGGGRVCGSLPENYYRFDSPHSLEQITTGIARANKKTGMHYGPEVWGKESLCVLDANFLMEIERLGCAFDNHRGYRLATTEKVLREIYGLYKNGKLSKTNMDLITEKLTRGEIKVLPETSMISKMSTQDLSNILGKYYDRYVENNRFVNGKPNPYLVSKKIIDPFTGETLKGVDEGMLLCEGNEIADGRLVALAKSAAEKGIETTLFTDDRVMKGVIDEINKDLVANRKPAILAGGVRDYAKGVNTMPSYPRY